MEKKIEVNFRKIIAAHEGEDILRLANVELKTDDGCVFTVHKLILARQNDYFRKLFCCFGAEEKKEFKIPGVSGEILSSILIYLYTRKFSVTDHNIADLIMGADYLCVDDLVKDIENEYEEKISVSNSMSLLLWAHQMNIVGFFNDNLRFIETRFEDIWNDYKAQFAELPLKLLSTLLSSERLKIFDERLVWLVIVEWVQNDIQNRLQDVPFLLRHLARKQIDETLSREIMSHNIVKDNLHCKTSSDCKSEESLQSFLEMNPDSILDYRIPPKLHVIAKKVEAGYFIRCHIYVTCDKTLDMWRKIAEVEFRPIIDGSTSYLDHNLHIVPMQHSLYMFLMEGNYLRLDLIGNRLIQMGTFFPHSNRYSWEVVENRRLIYVLSSREYRNNPYVQILDPETNLWRNGKPHFNVDYFKAASISGKIYVVGSSRLHVKDHSSQRVIAQVYDPESDAWSLLPSSKDPYPNIDILIHREKFFVIGGLRCDDRHGVEIFEPDIGNWRQVTRMPLPHLSVDVLNDQIIAHHKRFSSWEEDSKAGDLEPDSNENVFCWQDTLECWGKGELHPLLNCYRYLYWEVTDSVTDSETIRFLYKADHYQNIEPESCCSK